MSERGKKLTIDDISSRAGVSRSTVSRVINDYPHISPEVRERVQAVIKETGYRPNRLAQSLASSRTGMIGLVIPHAAHTIITNPYFLHLINGITSATNQNQLTLALFLFHSMEEENRISQSIFSSDTVEGVIVTADRREGSFVKQLVQHGVPVAFVGRPEPGVEVSYVNVDNENGGFIATEHLIQRGYRRIAMIGSAHNTAGEDRQRGFQKALETHNISYDDCLVVEGDFSLLSGYEAMKTLLPERPEAVFVSSDLMALGAQRAIKEAGMRIPEDIAVVGFDDLPEASISEPPLTTVKQSIEKLGFAAVEMLREVMERPGAVREPIVFPVELIERAT